CPAGQMNGASRSGQKTAAAPTLCSPASRPLPAAAWPAGSAPRHRPTSAARQETSSTSGRLESTSAWSRAPTSNRTTAPCPTGNPPTSPTCVSRTGSPSPLPYLRPAHRLAEPDAQFSLATHDGVLREALLTALGPRPVEQLLGVRPTVLDELVARGIPVRVYVPFGDNWFRYWMRRLAESRGA